MSRPSVVAVYGVPAGEHRPRRLGAGSLEMDRMVLLDEAMWESLDSEAPPELVLVGIASMHGGEPFVEVIDIRTVLKSERSGQWAAELRTRAESPTNIEAMTDPNGPSPSGPANGWCYVFPKLSYC